MKRNCLTLVLVILFLAGCAKPPVTIHPTMSPTPALRNIIAPTMTITPNPTLTSISGSTITQQCVQVMDQENALKDVTVGSILLHFWQDGRFVLKDIQTGVEYKLPMRDSSWDWYPQIPAQISPDGKMLAQLERVNNTQSVATDAVLWVFNAQAKVLSRISLNRLDIDLGSVRWLDNQRLIIGTESYATSLVVNPTTGEQQVVSNELPNLFTHFNPWPMWRVVYSADLEWVVYYGGQQPPEGPVVYNVVTNQILWQARGENRGRPAWSPDGEEVAVVGGIDDTQIYLINRLGQARAILMENPSHNSFAPSWSPDGQYLVFWDNGYLMVYDKHTNLIIDLCIPWAEGSTISYDLPSWSMNSHQFIIAPTGLTTLPIFVDLQKKVAYKIKDSPDSFIVGWMNSLP